MGLLDSPKSANSGASWYLPSGAYPAALVGVQVHNNSQIGSLPVYETTFIPESDEAPNPLELPRVKFLFDMNDEKMRRVLWAIVGTPSQSGDGSFSWDGGIIKWNGQTDAGKFRAAGKIEVTVESKAPQKSATGFFPAKYAIVNFDRVGASEERAQAAAAALASIAPKQEPLPAVSTNTSAPKGEDERPAGSRARR